MGYDEDWITPQQIAGRLNISVRTVHTDIKKGVLKATMPPGKKRGMLVAREDYEAYAKLWGGEPDR